MKEGTKAGIEKLRPIFKNTTVAAAAEGGDGAEGEGANGPAIGLVQDLTSLNKHVFNQAGIELGEYGSLIL